ncbi:single-stranded-DNA-specific exonuclease [Striga asiatica]|uniref:Single-stranded-DNA-specific exonuclease n=1 Tax=Striga asiatica TaxID=4170 RepID=A0A5A7QSZ1_STRAF|nr:single-stranded-DNA-specific exonuclease [Striga asiatica]
MAPKISHNNFLIFLLFFLLWLLHANILHRFPASLKHLMTFQNTEPLLILPSQELHHLEHNGPLLGLAVCAHKPDQNNPLQFFLRIHPTQLWVRQLIKLPLAGQRQGPFGDGPPGLAARNKLEQEYSKTVDIASLGGLAKHCVLRSEVAKCAFDIGGHEDVAGLDVSVDDVRGCMVNLRNALGSPNSNFQPSGPVEMTLGRMLPVKMRDVLDLPNNSHVKLVDSYAAHEQESRLQQKTPPLLCYSMILAFLLLSVEV